MNRDKSTIYLVDEPEHFAEDIAWLEVDRLIHVVSTQGLCKPLEIVVHVVPIDVFDCRSLALGHGLDESLRC